MRETRNAHKTLYLALLLRQLADMESKAGKK